MRNYVIAVILTALLAAPSAFSSEGWIPKWSDGLAKGSSDKKDILVVFTGSDWCPPCKALKRNIFAKEAFMTAAPKKFVLVELDFPRRKAQDAETKKVNREVATKFGIRGYPTVLLLDSKGRPYSKVQRPATPEAYLKHLDELVQVRVKRDAAFAEASKLEGVDKAKALVKALNMVDASFHSFYKDVVDQIAKADPEDKSGFVKAQKLKTQMKTLAQTCMGFARANQRAKSIETINKFITDNKLEGTMKQEAMFMHLMYSYTTRTIEEVNAVEKIIDEMIKIDANSPLGKRAAMIKERMIPMIKKRLGQ